MALLYRKLLLLTFPHFPALTPHFRCNRNMPHVLCLCNKILATPGVKAPTTLHVKCLHRHISWEVRRTGRFVNPLQLHSMSYTMRPTTHINYVLIPYKNEF